MRHLSSLVASSACAASVALFSFSAAAHIELLTPAPRYTLPSNKSCPCGDGDSNRRCEQTAEESSDPNRSTNVTTFEAGSTITVTAEEYIDHAGRMRVAFDDDGADLADFNDNILLDEPDPSGTTGKIWQLTITLPSEPCDNCTLQVIQAMHGDTVNPVLDPAPLNTYYSCADIRLVAPGTLEQNESGAGGNGAAGSASAGEAGAAGAAGAAGSGGSNAAAGRGGTGSGTAGAVGAVADADDEEDDGGCAFEPARSSGAWGSTLVLFGLVAARIYRRRVRV